MGINYVCQLQKKLVGDNSGDQVCMLTAKRMMGDRDENQVCLSTTKRIGRRLR